METYVGHRYVPKIMGVWDKLLTYENLSIVTYDNSSYTSKTIVPVGVDISNEKYWVKTGDYNAQVEEFKNDFTAQLAQNVYNVDLFKKRPEDIDDTERLQRAVNYAHSLKKPLILNGEIYYVRSLKIPAGFKLYGNGSLFKKPDMTKPPYNYTAEKMKWVYILQLTDYSGNIDSEPTIVDGITFDGNCWSMWDVPSYEQEQASLIFAQGDRTKAGRLSLKLSNCHFKDNVSDGIHLWYNVIAQINNCSSVDCFRGGVTVTGGHAKINVSNFISTSVLLNDGFDIEVDTTGYNGSAIVDLNIDGLIIDTDLDIHVSKGSQVNLSNITLSEEKGRYYLGVYRGGTLNVINSKIVGANGSPNTNRLLLDGKATFDNCDFLLKEYTTINDAALYVFFQTKEVKKGKDSLGVFNNCRFKYIGVNADTLNKQGVNTGTNDKGGTLKFVNCYFDESLHTAISAQCSRIEIQNTNIDTRFRGLSWTSNSFNTDNVVVFDGVNVLNEAVEYMRIDGVNATLINKNLILDELKNKISGNLSSYHENPASYLKNRGERVIYVDHDPNIEPYVKGLVGDVAIHKNTSDNGMTKKWLCTRHQKIGTPYNSVWKDVTTVQ